MKSRTNATINTPSSASTDAKPSPPISESGWISSSLLSNSPLSLAEDLNVLQEVDFDTYFPSNSTSGSPSFSHMKSEFILSTPSIPLQSSKHGKKSDEYIRRPPNAFMIFRSDFLKTGTIPLDVERRQQNLSQIAGEVWRMMPEEEKDEWRLRAKKEQEAHSIKYPDYKFAPAPRRSKRPNVNEVDTSERRRGINDKERIRQLREMYTHLAGPAPPPSRRRQRRTVTRKIKTEHPSLGKASLDPPVLSLLSPPITHLRAPGESYSSSQLPPMFPPTVPHVTFLPRRPSTALGLTRPANGFPEITLAGPSRAIPSKNRSFQASRVSASLPGSPVNIHRDIQVTDLSPIYRNSLANALAFDNYPETYYDYYSTLTPPSLHLGSNAEAGYFSPFPHSYDQESFMTLEQTLNAFAFPDMTSTTPDS